jgi:cellulose synthase/poly-beta-1,6-N-acetylglucosamine synthase-like glycosyltransferase
MRSFWGRRHCLHFESHAGEAMVSIIIPTYNEEGCLEQVLVDAFRL